MKNSLLAIGAALMTLVVHGASVTRDIAYDSSIGNYGLGDLYLPDRVDASTPMVLVIHGGGEHHAADAIGCAFDRFGDAEPFVSV